MNKFEQNIFQQRAGININKPLNEVFDFQELEESEDKTKDKPEEDQK